MGNRGSFADVRMRRGAVGMLVLVTLTVLLGLAALTADVGAMYNAKADLQRAADASALAAARELGNARDHDPVLAARLVAAESAARNGVFGRSFARDGGAVTLGRSVFDGPTTAYAFLPTEVLPDSVRVRAYLTDDTSTGALGLWFANLMGHTTTQIQAEAIAMLVPRDIAVVADLSGSHTDDSELFHYRSTKINLFQVWDELPGGIDEAGGGLWATEPIPPEWVSPDGTVPQAAGPGWGFMRKLGWGSLTLDAAYAPSADPGLVKLPYSENWNDAALTAYLAEKGYNVAEISAIMSSAYDPEGAYQNRVAIALGLAFWNSGLPGGLWETRGAPPGNANGWIGDAEVEWTEAVLGTSIVQSPAIWRDYMNYLKSTSSKAYQANAEFRYRYGMKTLVNFLLEQRPSHGDTAELAHMPTQPMQAVKDATAHLTTLLTGLGTNDRLSLEIYGTTARHEVDLTSEFSAVSDRLSEMQAAHYDSYTNTGGGITRALEELTGSRARNFASKSILLLTDGNANVSATGSAGTSEAALAAGADHALAAARAAADAGIRIFAVSVGDDANQSLMERIAGITDGEHFHAEGSIADYSAALRRTFHAIGLRRDVRLIR